MKVRIEQILPLLGDYREADRYYVSQCCFHDDASPSLLVFKDGYFRCLATTCGRTGTWSQLWNRLRGWTPLPSTEKSNFHRPFLPSGLREQEAICNVAHDVLLKYRSRGWYLDERGVGDQVEVCHIGWWNGWFTFPVHHKQEFKGMVIRAGRHIQDVTGFRFSAPAKQDPMLYVPDPYLVQHSEVLYVVFGLFDALTFNHLRLPVVTSTAGDLSYNPDWFRPYRKPIILVPDLGGERAAYDLAACLGWRGSVLELNYPEGMKDSNDFLQSDRERNLLAQITGAKLHRYTEVPQYAFSS